MIKLKRLGVIMQPGKHGLGKKARFNPGIALQDGIVHMLYRASDNDITDKKNYISSIGYARLDIHGNILDEADEYVIYPILPEESMGCEDPRIVNFEGAYYIFYTAYNGTWARVGIAKTYDFKEYVKIGFINHYAWDKDAFILPERIGDKIAYIHRIAPNIQIDYFDSIIKLVSNDSRIGYEKLALEHIMMRPEFDWESKKIGGGVSPIKTERGWLVYLSWC